MGRIVVINHLTLDGVMQAPGRREEDTRGGFAHGGWAGPNVDGVVNAAMGARRPRSGGLLLVAGRGDSHNSRSGPSPVAA